MDNNAPKVLTTLPDLFRPYVPPDMYSRFIYTPDGAVPPDIYNYILYQKHIEEVLGVSSRRIIPSIDEFHNQLLPASIDILNFIATYLPAVFHKWYHNTFFHEDMKYNPSKGYQVGEYVWVDPEEEGIDCSLHNPKLSLIAPHEKPPWFDGTQEEYEEWWDPWINLGRCQFCLYRKESNLSTTPEHPSIDEDWLLVEKPLYYPRFPYMIPIEVQKITEVSCPRLKPDSSPQNKYPPGIGWRLHKQEPASMESGNKMFGGQKNWAYRIAGDIRVDGKIYRVKTKFYESIVRFTITARSLYEAEYHVHLFEKFMELNEHLFQQAGILKVINMGRLYVSPEEEDPRLKEGDLIFRHCFFYFRTQAFQITGPLETIEEIDINGLAT